ncbi:LysE family translocator [Photobacterium sp. J15]|uniref:LysE family translocator n=1 Tax=Photobacterium sp. J15 TaxID=265901 RepID=UPI0007E4C635|nr:LysE family translocator [Photobacterium sp. J15]
MEIHTLVLFAVASLSINLIPGPDVIYIVSNTMRGKASAGTQAALGLGVGYIFHTLAAVFGLSALILSSAYAFLAVKFLGAIYLLYLGISSLLNFIRGKSKMNLPEQESDAPANVFRQGVIVSVLNPKVAMFFLSFLPQFVDTSSASASYQLLVLGLLFCTLATCCNAAYALLGNWVFQSAKAPAFSRVMEGASGFLLIGLAARIAVSQNRV